MWHEMATGICGSGLPPVSMVDPAGKSRGAAQFLNATAKRRPAQLRHTRQVRSRHGLRRQSASGDGAFARTGEPQVLEDRRPHESGVALCFPPQSMTFRAISTRPASAFASWTATAGPLRVFVRSS